jgi:hypothetical protein
MSDARYAYHEAGHAVAAAVLGFPFRSSGIHIDRDGVGTALIVRPSRKCSSAFSNLQTSKTRMFRGRDGDSREIIMEVGK